MIISDMIESTGEYSQYPGKGHLSYHRFQRSKSIRPANQLNAASILRVGFNFVSLQFDLLRGMEM
ncbi:MAG TPA: hypothetical protein VF499_07090 [Afipia sp.]